MMMKLKIPQCIKLIGLVCFLLSGNTASFAQGRPNIVWFVSEDNSPYLSAYGDAYAFTPTLDQFAGQSLLFRNAYANAPVCAPSRSTLITGVLSPTLGSQHMRSTVAIDSTIKFFPNYLKEVGYFTSLRLKRDYNIPNQEGTWDVDDWWKMGDALKGRKKDQPYFLFYNTWMTHEGKLHDDTDYLDYFQSTFEHLETATIDSLRAQIKTVDPTTLVLPDYLPDLPETRKDLARYYKLMQMMDLEFGHVLQYLKAAGELENTIIIYSSDHGGALGRSKRFLFESGLHIPLIIKFPDSLGEMIPNRTELDTDAPVSLVDLAPTILSLAEVAIPAHMQGRNILDANSNSKIPALAFRGRMDETYDMVRSIRLGKYRYVRNYLPFRPNGQHIQYLWKARNVQAWEKAFQSGSLNSVQKAFFSPKPPEQLFDVTQDPHNARNLATDPQYQEVLADLRDKLTASLKEIKDTGFIPEGLLFAQATHHNTTYQIYTEKQPLSNVIEAAHEMTLEPKPERILELMHHKNASMRFWGTVGAVYLAKNLGDSGPTDKDFTNQLKKLLYDSTGDTRVMAAEALFLLGMENVSLNALLETLHSENPFVVLRACNTLANIDYEHAGINIKLKQLATSDEKYVARKAAYLVKKNNL